MQNKKRIYLLCALVVLFCAVMAVVDGVLQVNYFAKSAIKLVLFLGVPALYARIDASLSVLPLFRIDRKSILPALGLGLGVFAVILGGYFLLRGVFDFSNITKSLTQNIGVHGKNFIYVSLYISFVNSLLEEFFFRGFAFLNLQKLTGQRFAYIFSAVVFALYHVAMMLGWFSLPVFAIVLIGLFAGGLIFNYLNAKSGTIYPSWLVHMFANFAINTIGFVLFGII